MEIEAVNGQAADALELAYRRSLDAGARPGWYSSEREALGMVAHFESVPPETAIGVAVALAPRQHWERVRAAVPAVIRGDPVQGFLPRSIRNADRIVVGVSPGVVFPARTSPKSVDFLAALLGDRWVPVIDVWAARACGLPPPGSLKRYREIAGVYVEVAQRLSVTPQEVQEVTWVGLRDLRVPVPARASEGAGPG